MHEILFRGKGIRNGRWYYGSLSGSDTRFIHGYENHIHAPISTETIGQYTGLTDKNGVKIFEGDIIKVDDDYDTFGKMAGEIREVWFKDGGFRLKPKYASSIARGDRGYWLEDGADYEVIGNAWDNPELLGGDGNERD